ncbi:MAG: hypothetical protein JW798_07200, partial [Prolixibacteraceae bacterium]|nr:hypothetical protein [Prolixibacteraceae bacterium]
TKEQIASEVETFNTIAPESLLDSINAFYPYLFIYDQEFGREMIDRLLLITKEKNPDAHYLTLTIKAAFHPNRSIELTDSAYKYAVDHGLENIIINYYITKSNYFRVNQQFDSSMVYLLMARDQAREDDFEGYVNILHQLGDIYYGVGLFDQAEKYYLMVDSLKGDPAGWDYWRRTVIRNNFGLIALAQKDYGLALSKFTESLNEIPDPHVTYSDSLSLCYDQRMIASILFKKGQYEAALENAKASIHFSKLHQIDEHLFPTYILLIRLYIASGKTQEMHKEWCEFKKEYEKKPLNLENKIAFTLINADVHNYLEEYEQTVSYLQSYKTLNDSLEAQLKTAAIVQLLTEKEFSKLETNYNQVKTTRFFLFVISGLLLISLVFLILRWRKVLNLNRLLTDTIQTKDKLFSVISHDLKSPFNSLLGLSEVLVEKMKNSEFEQAEEFANNIFQKSSELFALIENLLNWSASQRKTLKFNFENVAIKPVIQQVIELYKVQAGHKKIALENKVIEDAVVEADSTSLVTIFSNLVSNAIKFTPENGLITIKTTSTHHHLEIEVMDTGMGIPHEKIPHLFSLAHNESAPGTNNEKGTGLGLLICKEFIEKNGGSINVSSQPGKGTTFTVRLNLAGS